MPTKTPAKRTQALADAGAPQPKPGASPAKLRQLKKAAEAQIDDFLKKIGVPNPGEVTDESGWRYFPELGSAPGRAGVFESDGELYLRAEAPIMRLPSDRDLILPLMRELLELNVCIARSPRLGVKDEWVVVVIAQPVVELNPDDFALSILGVMKWADDLDDTLKAKYGGTSKKRVAPSKPAERGSAAIPAGRTSSSKKG